MSSNSTVDELDRIIGSLRKIYDGDITTEDTKEVLADALRTVCTALSKQFKPYGILPSEQKTIEEIALGNQSVKDSERTVSRINGTITNSEFLLTRDRTASLRRLLQTAAQLSRGELVDMDL